MKIAIASDHGGFLMKTALAEELRKHAGVELTDLGTDSAASVDYPSYAHVVAEGIQAGTYERGILVCGTGVGMSIAANRHKGIRAVCCSDTYSARLSREHNDTNVLCLGERVLGLGLAWEIVSAWLDQTASTNERHVRRRTKIEP